MSEVCDHCLAALFEYYGQQFQAEYEGRTIHLFKHGHRRQDNANERAERASENNSQQPDPEES